MKKNKPSRASVIMLTCALAVPTVPSLIYNRDMIGNFELMKPYLLAGLLLGVIHLVLRPVLRLITAPIGCLTFGLSGMVIDVGLIYLAAEFVDGFMVPNFLCALLTAMLINVICALYAR